MQGVRDALPIDNQLDQSAHRRLPGRVRPSLGIANPCTEGYDSCIGREIAYPLQTMTNLQPVDFKAVAAKGAFVYCYLRADGTPYYIGIADAGRWRRPFEKHNCSVPKQHPERVRVMRSSLTYDQAKAWEIRYIAHYGRRDLRTGILRNLTDGGEGVANPSAEARQKMAAAQTGRTASEEAKAKMRASHQALGTRPPVRTSEECRLANLGRKATEATRAKLSAMRAGVPQGPHSETTKAKIAAAHLGKRLSEAHCQKLSVARLGKPRSEEAIENTAKGRNISTAKKYNLDVERYLAACPEMRILIVKRLKKGHSGEDLWLPRDIQPTTAKFCREKGIDLNKYAAASRKVQCWVRDHFRRGKACPAEFAAA